MCSYSPKKLRSNNVKLDKFGAAKYVNQSRVRNMVDPIIATPDKYLKSLRKTTSSKEIRIIIIIIRRIYKQQRRH